MKSRSAAVSLVLGVLVAGAGSAPAAGQRLGENPANLQFFPSDIAPDSLVETMRGFSFALGVRCQYCHTGGDGISFEGVAWESDDDPDKRKARFMLRMTETLNRSMLPMMAGRDEPPAEITCKTCHRGRPRPALLTDIMRQTLDGQGADSAAALYSRLRERVGMNGMYDFGEWEMNVLAERLAREGRPRDAITIYRINQTSHPESISIALDLARLHEEVGDREEAIQAYERVLELDPGNDAALARLEALRGRK